MKKHILIIEPSSSGLLLIPAAQALGMKATVFTYNQGDRILSKKYAVNKIFEVDTTNEQAMFAKIAELHKSEPIDAILPGFEYFVPIAARLASQLSLPGLLPNTAEYVRYKDKMRDVLIQHNILSPNYIRLRQECDIDYIEKATGYPCVIKPTSSSGSWNVIKIYNREEALTYYRKIKEDYYIDLGIQINKEIIVEKYIDGKEVSVEGYLDRGEVRIVSITEKLLGQEPYFVEMGHIVSANLSHHEADAIKQYAVKVVNAMKINIGVFHCEIKINAAGPTLMEIAARLPGDNIVELIRNAYHVDLAQLMILSYLDATPAWHLPEQYCFSGIRFFDFPLGTNLDEENCIIDLKKLPGFLWFESIKHNFTSNSTPSSLTRCAKALFVNKKYSELKHVLFKSDTTIKYNRTRELR